MAQFLLHLKCYKGITLTSMPILVTLKWKWMLAMSRAALRPPPSQSRSACATCTIKVLTLDRHNTHI